MLRLTRRFHLAFSSLSFYGLFLLIKDRLMRPWVVLLTLVVAWCGPSHGDPDAEASPTAFERFEIDPKAFVPLEVGNRWTYQHHYSNRAYDWWEPGDEAYPEWAAYLKQFEVPGYPIEEGSPPRSLIRTYPDYPTFVIEITHTEWIDGFEYFVFNDAPYAWPPMPTFFWAGYKVRWSDDDVLLMRWNDMDIPLYDFSLQHEGIEEAAEWAQDRQTDYYSVSVFEYNPIDIRRLMIGRRTDYGNQIVEVIFSFIHPIWCPPPHSCRIHFVQRYGIGNVVISHLGWGDTPLFWNGLYPISATLSGQEIPYEQATAQAGPTAVRERSWGAIKREFVPIK